MKKKILSMLLAVVMLVSVLPMSAMTASATTTSYYVSASGNDSNSGLSTGEPLQTMQAALNKVAAGSNTTIFVMSDLALPTTASMNNKATVTICSQDGHNYRVYPSASFTKSSATITTVLLRFKYNSSVTFKNITFDGRKGGAGTNYISTLVGRDTNRPSSESSATNTYFPSVTLDSGTTIEYFNVETETNWSDRGNALVEVMYSKNRLVVNDGVIIRNCTVQSGKSTYTTNPNALLCCGSGSRMIINGGEIYNNKCAGVATAIINLGTNIIAEFNGCKIFNNILYTNDSYALHKRMDNATTYRNSYYYFGGTTYIYNNKDTSGNQKNVYTPQHALVYLKSTLQGGSHIGIYTDVAPTANLLVAEGTGGYTPIPSDAKYLSSDKETDYVIAHKSMDNKIYMIPHANVPAVPTGLVSVAPSEYGMGNGKITGVDSTMEYSLDDGETWKSVTGAEINSLYAGTVKVRYKETSTTIASEPTTVIVHNGHIHNWQPATVDAPETCNICGATRGNKLPAMEVNYVDPVTGETVELGNATNDGVAEVVDALLSKPMQVPNNIFLGWYTNKGALNKHTTRFDTFTNVTASFAGITPMAKDPTDEKMVDDYLSFELVGAQIRRENTIEDDESATTDKEVYGGLRYISSFEKDLYNTIGKSNVIEYGILLASKDNAKLFADHYGVPYDKYEIQYNTGVNGGTADTDFRYVTNVVCSGLEDHRTFDNYRLFTAVIDYEGAESLKGTEFVARSYIKYRDANGVERIFYGDYRGTKVFGGCSISYDRALTMSR